LPSIEKHRGILVAHVTFKTPDDIASWIKHLFHIVKVSDVDSNIRIRLLGYF
jgi:hypothetical protein